MARVVPDCLLLAQIVFYRQDWRCLAVPRDAKNLFGASSSRPHDGIWKTARLHAMSQVLSLTPREGKK
jgi:hypothetical protein